MYNIAKYDEKNILVVQKPTVPRQEERVVTTYQLNEVTYNLRALELEILFIFIIH